MELAQFIKRVSEFYDDCQLGFPDVVELKSVSHLEKQEETIHGMPYMLFEQHSESEDCYWGYFYFPLKKRKYIKVPFWM